MPKFDASQTKVFGISTDNTPSQAEFAKLNDITFPLLSDFAKREVSAAYGVLIPSAGVANRTTFLINKEGRIEWIQEGNAAIDISGADEACSRLAHRAGKQ